MDGDDLDNLAQEVLSKLLNGELKVGDPEVTAAFKPLNDDVKKKVAHSFWGPAAADQVKGLEDAAIRRLHIPFFNNHNFSKQDLEDLENIFKVIQGKSAQEIPAILGGNPAILSAIKNDLILDIEKSPEEKNNQLMISVVLKKMKDPTSACLYEETPEIFLKAINRMLKAINQETSYDYLDVEKNLEKCSIF